MKRKNPFIYIGLAFSSYIILSNLLSTIGVKLIKNFFPSPEGNIDLSIAMIVTSAIQYLIAIPVAWLILRNAPSNPPTKRKARAKDFFFLFVMLYPVALAGSIMGDNINAVISKVFDISIFNPIHLILNRANPIVMLLLIGIIGPIAEELITRKLIIDKTVKYGEGIALVLSATVFALIHGNFYQSFYAFGLGACFAYIYIKTGSIKYSSIMHIIINSSSVFLFLCLKGSGLTESYLTELTNNPNRTELLSFVNSLSVINYFCISLIALYFIIYAVFVIMGIILWIKKFKSLKLNSGEFTTCSKKEKLSIMFLNWGMLIFILVSIYTFVDNILMFARIS